MSGNDNMIDGNAPKPVLDERIVDLAPDRDQKVINSARHTDNSANASSIHSESEDGLVNKPKSRTASYFNVLFSGFALLSDGYQSGVISFVNLFLGKIYGPDVFNADMKSRLSYAMFVGAIVGQLGKVF